MARQNSELYLNFGEYGQHVDVAAISSNGQRVLLVHEVEVARVYDLASSTLIAELCPTSPLVGTKLNREMDFRVFIESADLNADGSKAILGLNDGSAHLYDVTTAQHIRRIKEPIGKLPRQELKRILAEKDAEAFELVRCVRFSPNSEAFAIGHFASTVSVWATDGTLIGYYGPDRSRDRADDSPGLVTSIEFSSDGHHVFVCTEDSSAFVWEIHSQSTPATCCFAATEHIGDIHSIRSTAECVLWVNSLGQVWQQADDGSPKKIYQSEYAMLDAELSPSARYLLNVGNDSTLRRIDLTDGSATDLAAVRSSSLAVSEKPMGFLGEQQCWFWSDRNEFHLHSFPENKTSQFSARYSSAVTPSSDGSLLCAGSQLLKADVHELIGKFSARSSVGSTTISPDGRYLVVGELGNGGGLYDRYARLYNIITGEMMCEFVADEFQILGVDFLNENRFLTKSATIAIWDIKESGVHLVKRIPIENHSNEVFACADGRFLRFSYGKATLFDCEGNLIQDIPGVSVRFQPFHVDEKRDRLYLAKAQHEIHEFDIGQGRLTRVIAKPLPRYERWPTERESVDHHQITQGVFYWKTEYGNFAFQGWGPRGWVVPIRLSSCGQRTVLPCREKAIVVDVLEGSVIKEVPFEGTLRASTLQDTSVTLVNSAGRVFQANL